MKTKLLSVSSMTLFAILLNQNLLGQTQLVTLASSDFETNADGWIGTNNAGGSETVTNNQGGATSNSVGYLSISESAGDGSTMYFVAPPKFLGDKHAAYNGLLRFNFRQSATSDTDGAGGFVILGTTNLVLSFSLRTVPNTSWGPYEIPINENVGWFNVTSNRFATRDDFYVTLKTLAKVWIRGEFSYHESDRSDLDDVMLLGQPSGPLQPTLTAANYAGITIYGEVGACYRIEYQNSLGGANGWQALAKIVLPVSPYLFIDSTSPNAQSRMYRTVLLDP